MGIIAVMGALSGCQGSVTKKEADRGWRSAQSAMASAGVATGVSISGTVGPGGVSGAVEGSVACPEGGTLLLIADGEVTDDDVSARLHLEFDGCKADGVTSDGALDYEAYVGPDLVSASYAGELHWTGKAKGSCVIDASAEVSAAKISVSFNGEICGHDWSDL